MTSTLKPWVVAYSLIVKDWESGGELATYDRQFYDVYLVEATDRDDAEWQAKTQRRKQRLTGHQLTFMTSLLQDVGIFDTDPTDWIEIVSSSEKRLARRLRDKGLLLIRNDHKGPIVTGGTSFEVKLLPPAFNFQERNPAALAAYRREAKAHRQAPPEATAPRRPRLRS